MEKLTFEKAKENKFNWVDCVRYYYPQYTDDECSFILWNRTCFPFDSDTTLKQLYELFLDDQKTANGVKPNEP